MHRKIVATLGASLLAVGLGCDGQSNGTATGSGGHTGSSQSGGATGGADLAARPGEVARGDHGVRPAGARDARAVGARQPHPREGAPPVVDEPRLVVRGHTLGYAHDEGAAGLGRPIG